MSTSVFDAITKSFMPDLNTGMYNPMDMMPNQQPPQMPQQQTPDLGAMMMQQQMAPGQTPQMPAQPQQPPQGSNTMEQNAAVQQAPQGAPPPANPLDDVQSALMSGMDTPEAEALSAFEAGAQPFEREWANTQNQRFRGGIVGLGEQIYDMVKERKLQPQRDAMNEARARLTKEGQLAVADQKYKDAVKIIGGRDSKLSPEQVDAMARRYAQGEDLAKLAPDKTMTEYQREMLALNKSKADSEDRRAMLETQDALTAEQKEQGLKMFDRVEPVVNSYNAAQNTMERLLQVKERYGDNPGPAGIQAMYDFIKSIDPDSVVREGEVKLTEQGQGYMTQIQNMMDKAYKDQILPEDFMSQIVNMAQYINQDLQKGYAKRMGTYYNLAEQHEIPFNLVFGGESLTELARTGAQEDWALQQAQPITGADLNQSVEQEEENQPVWDVESQTWR